MTFSRSAVFVVALAGSASVAMAQGENAYGITGTSASNVGVNLISFNTGNAGAFTTVGALSGVVANHAVRGIDFRPFNGVLYALSTDQAGTEMAIYTVNLTNGAMSQVGSTITGIGTPGAVNNNFSIDFNPSVDRLRVVNSNGQSYRINPMTGGLAGTDSNIAYASGTIPDTVAIAYDNNIHMNGPTTLFAWDWDIDDLFTIGGVGGSPSPNLGQAFPVSANAGFFTNNRTIGMDISSQTGFAYLSYDLSGDIDGIAQLNLSNGTVSGFNSFGVPVLDFSIVIPSPSAAAVLGLGGLAALRRRR